MAEKLALKDNLFKRLWYLMCRTLSVGAVWLFYRVKIYGRENVPESGPTLVLSNHQSFFDPMLSQSWVRRPFYFVPRDTLLEAPFWGRLIKSLYVIPIKRGQTDIAAIKTIIEALRQDKAVCLYPEGTRTPDGKIGTIKPGFGLISRRTGATIVPVVIDGMFEAWPRTQKFPRPGRVGVIYGRPIEPEYIKSKDDAEFTEELIERMRTLQAELRKKMGRRPFDYSKEN